MTTTGRSGLPTGSPAGPPTLTTVAELAGVSRQTVSNALNNPELLRPDTLERVLQVIADVGYTPNRAARQLRSGSSHLIGLRFEPAQEGTTNALMDRFLHTLVETTRQTGHHVLLFSGDPDDPLDGYDDLLRSTAVDAFVITDTYSGTPQAAWLQEREAPFVAFGRPWDDPHASHAWVDVDGSAGTRLATQHLLEQGYDRVAWLGWEKSSRIGEDRRTGWKAAMNRAGLDTSGLGLRITDNLDAARLAAHELLDRRVVAFVCASDTQGMGVLRAFVERGMRSGVDAAVVGFDDSLAAQVTGLSSVRQPLEQVAVEVVGLLRATLAGAPAPERGLVLTPSLVVRTSSQRPD
ncbi:LacI family transcriptional regulator [Nocardioides mangrovicus]|uniref:LacI family transcriptional regulator n=1 Tax=Nocardioides mangrovicus TaxID=2478913 RepID=A0A3L8P674_9ACTN|nr:LacI family DNA-binding transcriptional regulator [Nocardioides mangrovicus]RLV50472.1 LacI family transcriptional regulator [Nocardioides mangrovicus]